MWYWMVPLQLRESNQAAKKYMAVSQMLRQIKRMNYKKLYSLALYKILYGFYKLVQYIAMLVLIYKL